METVYFLPSELARLVLGYIKEEGYKTTCRNLLKECSYLSEYVALLKRGIECPTTINGLTLSQILEEYAKLKLVDIERRSMTASVCTLWKQLDSIVTNLREQTSNKKQTSIQLAHTRRQVCNNRISNENSGVQRATRRSLNLINNPDCDSRAQTAVTDQNSSADEQEANSTKKCISRVSIRKCGSRITVKNSTPNSLPAVQDISAIEKNSPIRTVSTLLDDCDYCVTGSEPQSSNISENSGYSCFPKLNDQTDLCNDGEKLNTKTEKKLISHDAKSSFKCQKVSENSSHGFCDEMKHFSGSEDSTEFENRQVIMETDFNISHDSSPNEKTDLSICDTGDFDTSESLLKNVASHSSIKAKKTVKFCENSEKVIKPLHVTENVCCLQDRSISQTKPSINDTNICLKESTVVVTTTMETNEIVGSVTCQTTALHSSDSGLAPSVLSESRSDEVEMQSISTEKTHSEVDLEKTDCAAAKSLFSFSTVTCLENSPQEVEISEAISQRDEPALTTTPNSPSKNLIPPSDIQSESPDKVHTTVDKNCSDSAHVHIPQPVTPSKVKSEGDTLVSNPDEDSQPPFQFSLLKTPVKCLSQSEQGRIIGKSPRRKRPPRKRSGPYPERSDIVLADSNESVHSADNNTTQDDSMPQILEQILGDKTLHEKLAESINRGLHVDNPSTSRHLPLSAKLVEPKSSSDSSDTNSSNTLLNDNNETQQTLEEILDIHENQMSSNQLGAIIDMTQNDPAFDALFNLFHVDKNEYIEREYLSLSVSKQSSPRTSPLPAVHNDSALPVNSLDNETSFSSNLKEGNLSSDQSMSTHTSVTVSVSVGIMPSDLESNNKGDYHLDHPVASHSLLVSESELCNSKQTEVVVNNQGHLGESSQIGLTAPCAHLGNSPGLSTIKRKDLLALGMSHVTFEDEVSGDDNGMEEISKISKSSTSETTKMLSKPKSGVTANRKTILCSNTDMDISTESTMSALSMDNLQALQSLFGIQNLPETDKVATETDEISKFGSAFDQSSQPITSCNTVLSQAFTEPVMTSCLQQPIIATPRQKPSTVSLKVSQKKRQIAKKIKADDNSSAVLPKLLPKKTELWSTGLKALVKLTSPQKAAITEKDKVTLSDHGVRGYKTVNSIEGSVSPPYIHILSPGGSSYINTPFVQNRTATISSQASEITSVISPSFDVPQHAKVFTSDVLQEKSEPATSKPEPVYIAIPMGKSVPKAFHARTLNFGCEVETEKELCIKQPILGRVGKSARIIKGNSSCYEANEVGASDKIPQKSHGSTVCVDDSNVDCLVETPHLIRANMELGSNKTSGNTVNMSLDHREEKTASDEKPNKIQSYLQRQNKAHLNTASSSNMQILTISYSSDHKSKNIESVSLEKNASRNLPLQNKDCSTGLISSQIQNIADPLTGSENGCKKVLPMKDENEERNDHPGTEEKNMTLCMPDLVDPLSSLENRSKKKLPIKADKTAARYAHSKIEGKNTALCMPDLAEAASCLENSNKKVSPMNKDEIEARNGHPRTEGKNTALCMPDLAEAVNSKKTSLIKKDRIAASNSRSKIEGKKSPLCMPDLAEAASSSENSNKKVLPIIKDKISARNEHSMGEEKNVITEKSIRKREMKDSTKFLERNSDVYCSQKIRGKTDTVKAEKGKTEIGGKKSNIKNTKSLNLPVLETKANRVKKKYPVKNTKIENDQSLALRGSLREKKGSSKSHRCLVAEQVSEICPITAENPENLNSVNSRQLSPSAGAGSLDSMENVSDIEQFHKLYPNASYRDTSDELYCKTAVNIDSSNSSDFLNTKSLHVTGELENTNAVLHSSNIKDLHSEFESFSLPVDEKNVDEYLSISEEEIDVVGDVNFSIGLRERFLAQQSGSLLVGTDQTVPNKISANSSKCSDSRNGKYPGKYQSKRQKAVVMQPLSFKSPKKQVKSSPKIKSHRIGIKSSVQSTSQNNKASSNVNTIEQKGASTPSRKLRSSPKSKKDQMKYTSIFTDEVNTPNKNTKCFPPKPCPQKDGIRHQSRKKLPSPVVLDRHENTNLLVRSEPLTNITTDESMGIPDITATKLQTTGKSKGRMEYSSDVGGKRKRASSGEIKTKKLKASKDSSKKKPPDLACLDVEKFLSTIHC